jgi:omega-3 fatty acid desaturase (delta-15 desaturase)
VHSFILVPYHGWRINHRTHHSNHGHVERDESWYPVTESLYKAPSVSIFELDFWRKFARLQFPLQLLVFPGYLWTRGPGKRGSHYVPSSDLFDASEWLDVTTSTSCWLTMASILVWASSTYGFLWMLKLYFVPYLIGVVWLDFVTYLHHHGYEKKVPWYRGQEWSYMRGGLSTIDSAYSLFNKVHHDILKIRRNLHSAYSILEQQRQVRSEVYRNSVQKMSPDLAFLKVPGRNQQRPTRMLEAHALSLHNIHPLCQHIQKKVADTVI